MAHAMIVASSFDAALARQLEAALREGAQAAVAPQPPDLDNSDMRAGAEAAIRSSEAIILTVSEASLDDRWIRFAAETARKSGRLLIPVLAGPVEEGALAGLTGGPDPVPAGAASPFNVARDLATLRMRLVGAAAPILVAASADAEIAREAALTLGAAGVSPLLLKEPDLGDWEARSAAQHAIQGAPAAILLLTEAAMSAPWVRFAAEAARKAGVKLVPVLYQPIEESALLYLTGGAEPLLLDSPEESEVAQGERALGAFEARHAEAVRALLEEPKPIRVVEETLEEDVVAGGVHDPAPTMDWMDERPFEGGAGEDGSGDDSAGDREAVAAAAPEDELQASPPDAPVADAPSPAATAPSKKTAVQAGSPDLDVGAGASAPQPAPGVFPPTSAASGPMNAADEEVAAEPPPRADRMRRAEAPASEERRRAPSTAPFRAAKLFENAPRRMRVGHPKEVTVRISRDKSGGEGMSGAVTEHQILAASAMTVTLDDPSFGYAIRPLTPATQWVDRDALAQVGLGLEGQPAEWRWSVEPLKTGVRPLVIRASARVTDASGMSADAGLPEQMIEIQVGVDPAAVAKNALKWTLFAMVAGVLGHYGEIIVQTVRAFLG